MNQKTLSTLAALALSACLIFMTKHITFLNQGDYNRVVGVLLDPAIGDLPHAGGYVFPLHGFSLPSLPLGSSLALFTLFAWVQSVFSIYFDLFLLAAAAKTVLVFSILGFSVLAARSLGRPGLRIPVALVLLVLSFASHNVAIFNTLYTEYVMFLLFPLLMTLIVQEESPRNAVLLGAVALACATAKTQFFYLPTLLLACVALTSALRGRSGLKHRAIALGLAQLLALPALSQTEFARLNNHHATYLGSYMVLEPGEKDELGLDAAEKACIGVDSFGNGLATAQSTHIERDRASCFADHPKKLSDVLKPYLKNPLLLYRLASEALPIHFTGNYFHVDAGYIYLRSTTGGERYGAGKVFVSLTRARDRVLKYLAFSVLILGLALPFITRSRFDTASLLLVGLVVSQICISLIGEGVRDLSKHLMTAQLSVDWLLVLVLLQLPGVQRRAAGSSHAGVSSRSTEQPSLES